MPSFPRIAALPLAAALVATAGCNQRSDPSAAPSGTATGTALDAAVSQWPDAKPGIIALKARLVLPIVAGRPGAAYFTVRNDGVATAKLVAVHIMGAGRAEIHRTQQGSMEAVKSLEIVPGGVIEMAPGGLHAMVFDIGPQLKAGGTSELTLTFADGDKVSLPLAVERIASSSSAADETSAGSGDHGDHGMEGMQH